MLLMSWLKPLTQRIENTFSRKTKRRVNRQSQAAEFKAPRWLANRVEGLEDRALLTNLYVDNPADYTITVDQGAGGLDAGDTVTWNGSTNGGPVPGLIFGTTAFSTISSAITAAVTSVDTVIVAEGTFVENVVLNKQLTLKGAKFGVDARGRIGAIGVAPNPAVETVVAPTTLMAMALDLQTGSNGAIIDGFAFVSSHSGTSGTVGNTSGTNTSLQFRNNYVAVATGFTTSPLYMNRPAIEATFDQNEFIAAAGSTQAVFFDGADAFHGLYFTNNNVLKDGAVANTGLFVDGNRNINNTDGISSFRNPIVQGNLFQGHSLGFNAGQRSFQNTQFAQNTFTLNTGGFAGGPKDSTITQNTFSSNSLYGLRLSGITGASLTNSTMGAQNTIVTNNNFTGNGTTVDLVNGYGDIRIDNQFDGTQATNKIYNNSLGSAVGVFNKETNLEIIQVSGNWWGTTSNPETAGKILGVSAANVDYSPWLNSGTDTDGGTAGFQGSFSTVNVDDDSAFSTLAYGSVTPDNVPNAKYIKEGFDLLASTGTLNVHSGSYTENVSTAGKAVTLSPGASPGQVTINGNLTLDGNDALSIEIDGTGSSQYDSLTVNGVVTLNGATLNILQSPSSDLTPDGSTLQSFTIIGNDDGPDSVIGMFNGLDELDTVTLNGQPLYLSYLGGSGDATGNDVVLTSQPVINGTSGNDSFVLRRNAGNTATEISVTGAGGPFIDIGNPGGIVIEARGGDDTLLVDYVNGDPLPTGGVTFNGGGQSSTDLLRVKGTGSQAATYTPHSTINGNGTVSIGGKTITFTGLEPVDLFALSSVTVLTPNGNDSVTLADGTAFGSGASALRISGSSNSIGFETVAVWNTTSVTVDAATNDANPTSADDSVTVSSATLTAGNANITNLTINTGASGTDTVVVSGAVSLTGNLTITTGATTFNNTATAGGTVSVTSTGAIDINSGLTGTTGITLSSGTTTSVGANLQTDGGNVNFTSGSVVIDAATVTIDTESGNDGNAGNVNFTGASSLSANAASRDLNINANTTFATGTGGTVTLVTTNATGGANLDDLQVTTDSNTDGNINLNGAVTTTSSIQLTNAGTVDINADVIAGTTLTIQNATTVDLAAGVDLTTNNGALSVATGVTAINLSGSTGTNRIEGNGDALVSLANLTNTADSSLVVTSQGSVTLAGSNLSVASGNTHSFSVDDDNDGTETLTVNDSGTFSVRAATFEGGGTGTSDTIDINADITSASTLTIQNAATVDLAQDVDLTTNNGSLLVNSSVTLINLSGAAGINILTAGGNGLVNLAGVSDTGTPAELRINSNANITLTSVDIANLLDINLDLSGDGTQTLTSGALSAGSITVDGQGTNDTMNFNGTVTSTGTSIAINQANQLNFAADVLAATTLTITNINTAVDLAAGVDLTTTNGALSVVTSVTAINLSGANATTNIIEGNGDALVTLANLTDTNNPNLTVNSEGSITLAGADLGTGTHTFNTDNNDNGTETLTVNDSGTFNVGAATFQGGTGTNDTIDINADITAASTLTIQNAATVDLAASVDLTANNGALSAATSVTAINLSGANATTNIIDGNGDALVTLANLTDTNNPNLTVNSEGDITLAGADLGTGTHTFNADNDNDGTATLTVNDSATFSVGAATFRGGTGTNDTIDINADITAASTLTIQNASSVTIDASAARTLTSNGGDLAISSSVTTITLNNGSSLVTLDANGVETDTTDADVLLAALVDDGAGGTAADLTITADGGVTTSTISLDDTTDGDLLITADADNDTIESLTMNGQVSNVALLTLSGGTTANDTIDINANLTTTAGALTIQNASSVTIDASAARTLTSNGGDVAISINITTITLDNGSSLVTLAANGVETDTTDADVVLAALVDDGAGGTAADLTITADGAVTTSTISLNDTTDGDLQITVDSDNDTSETLVMNGQVSNVALLTLSGGGTGTGDTIDINANLTTTAGALTIQNAASVTIDASAARTLTSNGGDVAISSNITTITLDNGSSLVTLSANGIEAGPSDADVVLAALVDDGAGGTAADLTISAHGAVTTSTISLNDTTDGDLLITVDADNDTSETLTMNGQVSNVALLTLSGGGTGTGDTIDINVDLTTTAGALTIQNAANVTIDASAARTLTANGGHLLLASTIGAISLDNGGNLVTFDANGATSNVSVNAPITRTAAGDITLTADKDVLFSAAGDVSSSNGKITVTADLFDGTNTGGVITMAAGTLIDAGSGLIDFDADGDITLGGLLTTNNTASAVTIDSTSGGLIDGSDTFVNIVANNTSAQTTITVKTGIGTAAAVGGAADNPIETTVAILDASVTAAGSIDIDETDTINLLNVDTFNGFIRVDAGDAITATDVASSNTNNDANDVILTTASGNISVLLINSGTGATGGDTFLVATGAIVDGDTSDDGDITADDLSLDANGGAIATSGDFLDTNANNIEADAAGGVFLDNTSGGAVVVGGIGAVPTGVTALTGITATNTVRITNTAGLTIEDRISAPGQLVVIDSQGIYDNDADDAGPLVSDIIADQTKLISTAGIGTSADHLEITVTTLAFDNSTAGDVIVTDTAGGLTIGTVDSLTASSNDSGVVTITALSPLTVAHDVTASGDILMTATDSAGAGDNLTVNTLVTVESTGANVTLRAGDNLFLIDSSNVIADSGLVTLLGDFWTGIDPDVGTGSLMNLFGTISSGSQAVVNGHDDDDFINLNPGVGHFATSILLDGQEGSDTYTVQFGRLLAPSAVSVDVEDSGTGDDDVLTTNGTSDPEEVNIFNTDGGDGTALNGGFVQITANLSPLSASEQVNYNGNLERLIVNGQNGNEFFHVRPSQTTRIRINGGNTNFGGPVTDNPFIADPEILGDVLDLQTLDNTFNFIGTTFFVDRNGIPNIFEGITIRNLEYVPLIPTGTADPLRFDFDGSVGSPATQAGYTTVAPGRVYGSGTLNADYGWVGTAANFLDRGDVLSSSYENLLQDAHFDTVQRTFRVDVSDLVADGDAPQADGWYLVSLTFGDANSARSGVQVRNADNAGYLLLTTPNTVAGQFYTATLVVQVFDGTIDLQFQSATADPRWQVNGMEIQPGEILTFGSPDPGPLVADGLTEDTFFGYEAEIGALITVRPGIDTSGDEIPDADLVVTSPDMDPDLEGVQRLVGPDGLFSYTIRRPSVAGSAFVSFQATHPTLVTETGSLAIDYVLPEIRRYDFNSDSSPTQAPVATPGFPSGYVGVVPTDLKTPTNGYGWVTSPSALDRGAGLGDAQANLRRDGAAGTSTRTFQTQLDPGTYFVNVTLGDKNAAHDNMQVTANGTLMLPDVDTGLGQFFHSMFQVATTGSGLISFEFTDAGGSDPTWVANGMEIRAGSQVNQATGFVSSNPGSQPADGGTIDTITVTFPNTIAAGTLLTVTSSLGTIVSSDSSSEYLGTQVLGTGSNTVVFQVQRGSAGGTPTFTLTAVDGSAFASLSNSTSLQYTAPQSRRFDFNAPGGPTQTPTNPPTGTGYQGVAPTVLYSAAQGYGWVSTSPSSFDRGVATGTSISDFVRDGASSNSSTRDFRIDNLGNNTSYTVTVTMGDLSVAHDQMSVSVITGSGTGASGITTAAGAVTQRTFTATSNASGTLVFRFGDADMLTDGADTGWVVNGLELYANPLTNITVPSASPGAADPTMVDTITIGLIDPLVIGQVYTVTTTAGTLMQAASGSALLPDADSVLTGTQFTATATTASLFLKRPATAGVATITVTQLNGASSGTGTQTYTAPLSTRYDFNAIAGHGVTPNDTQAGFIGVAGNKLYSSGDGYGFLTTVDDASRGQATVTTRASKALYQDFVRGTSAGTFQLSVPVNQVYNLRFYSGDTAFAHDLLRITIEDGAAAGYAKTAAATPKNAFTTVIFNNIEDLNNDGILKIVFSDLTVSGSGTSTYEPFRWVVNGFDIWQVGATDPGQAPLTSESATTGGSDAGLTNAALAPIVREAIARWSATGLTAAEVALLKAITFQVTDLDAQHHLGLASEAEGKIQLDDNANGHGWFVDRTPRDNREFSRRGLSSELTARPNGPAAGHMDLLTVVMHEMGHFLGREHSENPQSLMAEDLSTGVRRLPVRETLPLSRSVLELGSSPRGSQVTAPAPNVSQAAALTSKLSKTPLTTANNAAAVNDRKRHETRDRVFADLKKFFAELETLNDR